MFSYSCVHPLLHPLQPQLYLIHYQDYFFIGVFLIFIIFILLLFLTNTIYTTETVNNN